MNSISKSISIYMRMIKFSHTIFALPLAIIAFLLALPESQFMSNQLLFDLFVLFLKIIICMVTLRSAAMGFNRLIDHKIDKNNPRTKNREIPAGKISIKQAGFFVLFSLVLFIITTYTINWLCFLLSPVAIFFVLFYSYTKRFTWLCHFFLGASIGLAPSAAWIAVAQSIEWLPILWSLGLLFYISGFDILYSCQDASFDAKTRLHSIPARFGISKALWVARFSHIISICFFAWAGFTINAGFLYWVSIIATCALFVVEHLLVRPDKLDKINVAFFNVNAIVSTVLLIGVGSDLVYRNQLDFLLQ